nr:ABC transporter permease [Acidobacteriota bacterium]
MQTLWQDLRYGARMLMKKPGFTLIIVITLALGIGANTAIFTVVNAALLRPLPYAQPEQLVHLFETTPRADYGQREASYPDLLDWRQNQVFDGMAAYRGGGGMMLNLPEGSERLDAGIVTANFFSVLGVAPQLGRAFQDDDEKSGAARVVIVSHNFWQRRFGGDAKVVGQSLVLSDNSYTVIGVLPPNFQFAPRGAADVWVTLQPSQGQTTRRFMHWVNVIARLKPGVTREQAQAGMQIIAERIAREHNDSHAGTNIVIVPLQQQFVGSIRPLLLVLLGAVGFVLLIACANVANLLLVRAAARQKEIAIRTALGASAGRLIRQWLTESLLLALIGGCAGLLLAQWGVELLIAAIPNQLLNTMPYLRGITIDRSALAFTAALSLLVSVLFGLAPALQMLKPDLQSALKEGGKTSAGAMRHGLRNALVVAEVALALVLLVGAGLMMKSLLRLTNVDPGFNPKNLLTLTYSLPRQKYDTSEKLYAAHQQLLSRLSAVPGIKGAATINTLPLLGGNTTRFYAASQPKPAPGSETEANLRDISANYFNVMEVPLVAGRYFNDLDTARSQDAIIINQSLAKQVFPNGDAVGQSVLFSNAAGPAALIVGVVGDEKITGLDSRSTSVLYYPYQQDNAPSLAPSVIVRTSGDPMSMSDVIRRECLAIEPGASVFFIRTMEQVAATSPATFMRRYPALLIGVFAIVALVLA